MRFVPQVPAEHAIIMREGAYHALHIGLEFGIVGLVLQAVDAGALHPAGIVHAGNGVLLLAQVGMGVPARIEQHEDRPDVMLRRDDQEAIDARLEAFGIRRP